MSAPRDPISRDLEATRLQIAWEIASGSEINKADPLYTARLVRTLVGILRGFEGEGGILPVAPRESKGAPGGTVRLTYNFTGGPTSIPLRAFVHFVDGRGAVVFQDDHEPPRPTVFWSERISYSRDVAIPPSTSPGLYRIRVGLYDAFGSHERMDLDPQQDAYAADFRAYEVGTLRVG
jgi:hypothetical protein